MPHLALPDRNAHFATGPYLVFLRARMGFSRYHDVHAWSFLQGPGFSQVWGHDSVLVYCPKIAALTAISDIPDWVDFIEVAAVSVDCAVAPFSAEPLMIDKSRRYFPTNSMRQLVEGTNPGPVPEKPFFDRKLLIVHHHHPLDPTERERRNDRVRRVLGPSSATVWHSADIFGFAFRTGRSCTDFADNHNDALAARQMADFAIFRTIASEARGTIAPGLSTPLQDFLAPRGRS